MSHFPAGQPYASGTGWPGTNHLQRQAIDNSNFCMAAYTATINVTTPGATALLFTTAANRGRFFPLFVQAACVNDTRTPAGIQNPVIDVGWRNPGNAFPYDDWVNQEGLQAVASGGFGPGNYNNLISISYRQYSLSAPASTGVYAYVRTASSATGDKRIVTVVGFYTG